MTPLDARIFDLYESLSPSERRLADIVLEHQRDLASYSATELARRAQVSKATAARLFKRLGYANYNEARRQARSLNHWGSPRHMLDYFTPAEQGRPDAFAHLQAEMGNLGRTFEALRTEAVTEAVDHIADAHRVWIAGFRNSYGLGHYARFLMSMLKSDVHLLPIGGLSFAEELINMTPEDVVLAIGFRRRPQILRTLLRKAQAIGTTVIFITDLSASVTAKDAHIVLRCHSRAPYLFDSYTAAVSVLNFLASALTMKLGAEASERLRRIDDLHDELDAFTTPPNTGRSDGHFR